MTRLLWFLFLLIPLGVHADEYVLASSYSPPYSTENHDGILERVLREAFVRAGHSVSFRNLPAERALLDAQAGMVDGVVARVRGMEAMYPELVMVPVSTIESRDFVAFTRADASPIRVWSDLAPLSVAYVRGWKIVEMSIPQTRSAIAVRNTELAFGLLARNRVDAVINARLDGSAIAGRLGIADVVVHEPPLASLSLYPYVHADNADLVEPLAGALLSMQADGTFESIYREAMVAYD